ncbi:hypothetical protein [Chitinimonas sp.]|uniref:hypothetical protein n=1 Tax=Chitinimonas sp. TaxID=1934313 RepID=UPI0035ADF871
MITIFDMASGEAAEPARVESDTCRIAEQDRTVTLPPLALRLLTVDEAKAMEQARSR